MTTSVETPPPAPAPAPPQGARMDWAPVPQVNLLPPEILAERRFLRLRQQLIGVGVGVVVLCAAGAVWAQLGVTSAQNDLATVQGQSVQLEAQQARFAEVPRVQGQLDRVKAAREDALGSDVAWYQFLTDLALNTPQGTQLTSVAITMSGRSVAAAPVDPLSPAGLGRVTVSGKALRFTDVAAWLDAVDEVHGLAGSSLELASSAGTGSSAPASSAPASSGAAGSVSSGDTITFSGSAVVVPAALSHRYDRKAD